jgi:hypothetical protein
MNGNAPRAAGASSAPTFLTLPPEVRNQTYRLLIPGVYFMLQTHPLHRPGAFGAFVVKDLNDMHPSCLFRCCRQVRDEALTMFYKQNHFKLLMPEGHVTGEILEHHTQQLNIWLESLGDCVKHLRRVSVTAPRHIPTWPQHVAIPLKASVPLLSICNAFWSGRASRILEVKFVEGEAVAAQQNWQGPSIEVDFECINNVIPALINDRDLGDKSASSPFTLIGIKHLRKAMLDIRLLVDCSSGFIAWRGSNLQHTYLPQKFRSCFRPVSEGRKLRQAPSLTYPNEGAVFSEGPVFRSAVGNPRLPSSLEAYLWNCRAAFGTKICVELVRSASNAAKPCKNGTAQALRSYVAPIVSIGDISTSTGNSTPLKYA